MSHPAEGKLWRQDNGERVAVWVERNNDAGQKFFEIGPRPGSESCWLYWEDLTPMPDVVQARIDDPPPIAKTPPKVAQIEANELAEHYADWAMF